MARLKINTLVERAAALNREIEKLEAPIRKKKEKLAKLKAEILQRQKDEGLTSCNGADGTSATMVTLENYEVENYNKFKSFIKRNDALDLLQLRINKTAYRERMQNRKAPIPGVKIVQNVTLRLNSKPKKR